MDIQIQQMALAHYEVQPEKSNSWFFLKRSEKKEADRNRSWWHRRWWVQTHVLGRVQANLLDLTRPLVLELSENMRTASVLESKTVNPSVTGTWMRANRDLWARRQWQWQREYRAQLSSFKRECSVEIEHHKKFRTDDVWPLLSLNFNVGISNMFLII